MVIPCPQQSHYPRMHIAYRISHIASNQSCWWYSLNGLLITSSTKQTAFKSKMHKNPLSSFFYLDKIDKIGSATIALKMCTAHSTQHTAHSTQHTAHSAGKYEISRKSTTVFNTRFRLLLPYASNRGLGLLFPFFPRGAE